MSASPLLPIMEHIPELGGRDPNSTTAKPPASIPMEQAPSITATSQVVKLFVDNHCSPYDGQFPKQSCLRINHFMDSSLNSHKVTKVSRVAGVRYLVRVVVATSGLTSLAEVSILVDVHSSGL